MQDNQPADSRPEESVEITPMHCYTPFGRCPDAHAWMLQSSLLIILILCVLLARRWLELPLIAFVVVLASLAVDQIGEIAITGELSLPGPMHYEEYAAQKMMVFVAGLVLSVFLFGAKRAVLWIQRRYGRVSFQ
jgi:hypothetical protein